MSQNTNPETGIRYGIIAAQNLHPDVVQQLQMEGEDVHWQETADEIKSGLKSVLSDYLRDDDIEDLQEKALEHANNSWSDDEPVYEGELDGVKYRTTWFGGALMIWVFYSPVTNEFTLCSPCVPNACDLDSPQPGGCVGYDVPADWRYTHD